VGALVAAVVGLPALRLRGFYLAVTTLAFALATIAYFLNPQFFPWVPTGRFEPTPLLGTWDYAATTEGTYQLSLIVFVLCVVAIVGIRRSRTGRVLVAMRENERNATAFGVSAVGTKLTAFAISGFFASVAGVVLVHVNGEFTLGLFPPEENLIIFTAAVVGGLGSILGAVLGAVFLKGGQWFLSDQWRLAASGIGVLVVLLLMPEGLGGACYRARDLWLRWIARRRGIVVPSLLADVATPGDAHVPDLAPAADGDVVDDDVEPAPAPAPTAGSST
jgi:branched-chain amino acid transport system permease protein